MQKGKRKEKRKESAPRTNKRGDTRGLAPESLLNLEPTKIKPGEVRNPKGWPKGKRHQSTIIGEAFTVFDTALLETVNKQRKAQKLPPLGLDAFEVDGQRAMWLKQMEKAYKGDTKAFEVLQAYIHGKPTTKVEVSGDPDNPIKHEHEFDEIEAEVDEWIEGWLHPVTKTKVTVKKKQHGNSSTDTGAEK